MLDDDFWTTVSSESMRVRGGGRSKLDADHDAENKAPGVNPTLSMRCGAIAIAFVREFCKRMSRPGLVAAGRLTGPQPFAERLQEGDIFRQYLHALHE